MPNARRDTRSTAVRTATRDTAKQAMITLYQQWYNALVSGLRLDPATFQLLQPNTPLGDTSDQLWAYYNSIPPKSLVNNFQLNSINRLYDNYRAVVNVLISQSGDAFRRDLADCYAPWMTYVTGLAPAPRPSDLPDVFFSWATIHCPGAASKGRNDLEAMLDDPIALAQQAVLDRSQFINGVPNFGATIEDLRDAVPQAPSASFHFDSETQSADTSASWAKDEIGGIWDFFSGGGSASWSEIQTKAAAGRTTISVAFQHALSFPAEPGNWYSSAALSAAHATKDNTLWKAGVTPNWDSTFGPAGNMQRFLTELIVVDGINLTMTSDAGYTGGEEEEIKGEAEAGIFPLFFAEAARSANSAVSFDDTGAMTVTSTSPAGNPVVLGAIVRSAAELLAGE
jgi:hypothetical protein